MTRLTPYQIRILRESAQVGGSRAVVGPTAGFWFRAASALQQRGLVALSKSPALGLRAYVTRAGEVVIASHTEQVAP